MMKSTNLSYLKRYGVASRLSALFLLIAVLLGSGFLFVKGSVYESKLIYSVDTIPPFYENEKVLTDFEKKFYSIKVFKDWKKILEAEFLSSPSIK